MATYRTMPAQAARTEVVNAFMRGVYGWMSAGLAVTAALAYFVASTPALAQAIWSNQMLLIGLVIGELGLVLAISALINRMSGTMATGLFVLYSALNGITLSVIFAVYSPGAIFNAFVTSAGMFGAMTIFGLTTKKDLTSWGSFLFMGLIGIIIASVVNIFLASPMMHFVISAVGVVIFTGLTAYDTQKLKEMGLSAPMDDGTAVQRGTILGALRLYLDFINLFLMLLRLFGGGRE